MEGKIIRHPLPPITDRVHPFYQIMVGYQGVNSIRYTVYYATTSQELSQILYVSSKEEEVYLYTSPDETSDKVMSYDIDRNRPMQRYSDSRYPDTDGWYYVLYNDNQSIRRGYVRSDLVSNAIEYTESGEDWEFRFKAAMPTFKVFRDCVVDILLVGGGGPGGNDGGGGGGGGYSLTILNFPMKRGETYYFTVGAGGTPNSNLTPSTTASNPIQGTRGGQTSFTHYIAYGGYGGFSTQITSSSSGTQWTSTYKQGGAGSSGGGGGADGNTAGGAGGSQGNSGGKGGTGNIQGGPGGSGCAARRLSGDTGGFVVDFDGVYLAGGGGGFSYNSTIAKGGATGGGDGFCRGKGTSAQHGVDGTGGGGGGGGQGSAGGYGGNGIVIIRNAR